MFVAVDRVDQSMGNILNVGLNVIFYVIETSVIILSINANRLPNVIYLVRVGADRGQPRFHRASSEGGASQSLQPLPPY